MSDKTSSQTGDKTGDKTGSENQVMNVPGKVSIQAGGKPQPIIPQTFEEVQRLANTAVIAGLFKPLMERGEGGGLVEEAHERTVARACLAIMTGADAGLSAAQSVQYIAVINGKCLIYGAAVPGILWSKGFDIEQVEACEENDWTASCTITRPHNGRKVTRTYSKKQAVRARLWDERPQIEKKSKKQGGGTYKVANESPWFRFPERMLGWRALGFAKTDGASDALMGLEIYENMIDITIDAEGKEMNDEPAQIEPRKSIVPTSLGVDAAPGDIHNNDAAGKDTANKGESSDAA